MRNFSSINDDDLQALVDGAFDTEVHQAMMEEVKDHPLLRARLEELFKQKFMLQDWWRSMPMA